MLSESRVRIVLASFGCLLFFLSASRATGEKPLGRVLYSHATCVRGVPVPGSETLIPGDTLTTSEEGSALIELNSGAKVDIVESSSVRFMVEGETVRAELLSGGVVSESIGKPAIIVTTPTYRFGPAQESESRFRVQLSEGRTTLAAAIQGNVIITARNGGESYILRESSYASIPSAASGNPDQTAALDGRPGADRVGTISYVVSEGVVRRQGVGAEMALKVDDTINWQDVARTSENGRLQVALADGSFLNIGSGSTLKILRHAPDMQQIQVDLNSGAVRVWTQPDTNLNVLSPTAAVHASGSDFIVRAQPEGAQVYCIEGIVSIQNADPAVGGQVILHAGEYSKVERRLAPSAAAPAPNTLLQGQIDLVEVPPANAKGQMAAKPLPGWHIGSLSEAESVGLLAGIAAGAVAGIAVPLATATPASPSRP